MPTAMTYTSLFADLQGYSERGAPNDTTVFNQIPRLINRAERMIAEDLKILGFKNVLTDTLAIGTSVYTKPDRWRATVAMEYGSGEDGNKRLPIYPRAKDFLRRYWPNTNNRRAPKYYADYDYAHWLILPTPDAAYNWEVIIYEQPAFIDDTNQTNWLTDYAPVTLLNASVLELFRFLRNMEAVKEWEGLYNTSKSGLNAQDLQRIIDNTTSRQKA